MVSTLPVVSTGAVIVPDIASTRTVLSSAKTLPEISPVIVPVTSPVTSPVRFPVTLPVTSPVTFACTGPTIRPDIPSTSRVESSANIEPVSYTHLTLPTKRIV